MSLFARAGKGEPFDWLVVGLGNPGPKYAGTRHNVGERAVRALATRAGVELKGGRDNALVAEIRMPSEGRAARVVLAFPITYMNESGQAVGALVRRYRIQDPTRIIVLQDELDLEPGDLRIKAGGGLAGHNGLRSITHHLKTQEYLRVRIGVGKPNHKDVGKHHVLSTIPPRERELFDGVIAAAADAVEMIVARGVDAAMQQYNGKR